MNNEVRTLGHILQACEGVGCVPEKYWVSLVEAIARRDQLALHAVCMRTIPVVFPWVLRRAASRASAEEATVEVFQDVWRRAFAYDPAAGTVLGWILNLARTRMIHRPRLSGAPETPAAMVLPSRLWKRLARRIAAQTGLEVVVSPYQAPEAEWEEVAPGIFCTLLTRDADLDRVAMLVRLAPGIEYPAHTHAGVEELYMLEGELTVDDRNLAAGDYLRSEPGSSDRHVSSRMGCSGVLITSTGDVLI